MQFKFGNIVLLTVIFFIISVYFDQLRSASLWYNGSFEAPLRDLQIIQKERRLRVVIDSNVEKLDVSRAKNMGYKYEMLTELAQSMGVKVEFYISNNVEETYVGLKTGRFDLAAKNLIISPDREKSVEFTVPVAVIRQMLVRRNSPAKKHNHTIPKSNQPGVSEKNIIIPKNSSYHGRISRLESEIGMPLRFIPDSVSNTSQLVAKVASGEIDYTICDESQAEMFQKQYRNIDISQVLGSPHYVAWAVRKNAINLKNYVDEWLREYQNSYASRYSVNKYFNLDDKKKWKIHRLSGKRISEFDEIIRQEALLNGWDWRLIASIIYKESEFNPQAGSWAGASGLMQLMPETAESFGVVDIYDPLQNIQGGIQLLNWLQSQFSKEITDNAERMKFVLAAYNAGLGHVKDAQRLAKKFGKDPSIWTANVDVYLVNKSKEQFYTDETVRWGYCRGQETFDFVASVISNYDHYCKLIPD